MTIRAVIVAAITLLTSTSLGQIVADFFPGQKLTASGGVEGDQLGYSVAIDGNTAVFGAWGTSSDAGSAYTFNRDESGNWSQGQELIAWDEEAMDMFGMSVAISDDTIVIGTPLDNQNGPSSGSVYVFERDGSGTWSETAKLTLTNAESGDNFGHCVSVSDDTLLVGAFGTDGTTGSAWIINRNPLGYWTEGQQLTASNGTSGDVFGNSVAIFHDTCMVGAFGTGAHAGSVYVFTSDASGIWSQAAELTATGGASGDYFGSSVDIDGDTCVIGALGTDDQTGMVCVFMFDANDMWSQVAELSATDGADGDSFGYSVAIDGNSCVIGADGTNSSAGSVYVYASDAGGTWSLVAELAASDGASGDNFGNSVDLDGDTCVIGAPGADSEAGSVYTFALHGDFNVINLDDGNTLYSDLNAAVQDAAPGERLAVRSSAFDHDGIIDASDMALQFIAVEPITMGTDLMYLPGDGSSFIDSDDVAEAGYSLAGSLIAPDSGQLIFSNLELDTDGELVQNNSSLFVYGNMNNHAGTGYLAGNIFADQGDVSTDAGGVNRISRDTDIYADYVNDGTTAVHRGTLYIYGDLSGSGTMLGDVDTGPGLRGGDPPAPGDGFSIGGSSALGADASLRMLDFDWTLGIGGDVDWAINDPSRFAMSGATLSLTGLSSGLQTMELMSADQGAVETTDFKLGTLRVEPGTVVTLVDTHDNAGDGAGSCEALYAGTIVVEAGASLLTNGCPVYAREAIIKGELDGDVIIIDESCQGDEDGDGTVDVLDLLAVISAWGACTGECASDFDSNGTVDVIDLLIVIQYWGACEE